MKYIFKFYKLCISPFLGTNCRFQPTCSEYSRQAFEKYNAVKASYLTVKRLLRCHPFGGSGIDNVPER